MSRNRFDKKNGVSAVVTNCRHYLTTHRRKRRAGVGGSWFQKLGPGFVQLVSQNMTKLDSSDAPVNLMLRQIVTTIQARGQIVTTVQKPQKVPVTKALKVSPKCRHYLTGHKIDEAITEFFWFVFGSKSESTLEPK